MNIGNIAQKEIRDRQMPIIFIKIVLNITYRQLNHKTKNKVKGEDMFASKEFFMLIPCLYLGLYVFSRVADIFHPNFQKNRYQFKAYNRVAVMIMVLIVIITVSIVNTKNIINKLYERPKNKQELYRLEAADYNIYFQDNGSANVEHILWLKRNKDTSDKVENVINYEFDEIGDISNIQVFVNNNEIEKNSAKLRGTFTTNLANKTNKIHINLSDKDEEIRLKINYYVKNSLSQKGDGYGTYYNKFLAHRSGLSYNTQFNGNIRFFMPKGSKYKYAGYCKDMYVEKKYTNDSIAGIYFENKAPHKFTLTKSLNNIARYDDFNYYGEYIKDFGITASIAFASKKDNILPFSYFEKYSNSIDDLSDKNKEKNKEYSDFLFLLNCFYDIILNCIGFIAITFPLIRWYYKKKLNEYWEYRSKWN